MNWNLVTGNFHFKRKILLKYSLFGTKITWSRRGTTVLERVKITGAKIKDIKLVTYIQNNVTAISRFFI